MSDLRFSGIHKRFSRRQILSGVGLGLNSGECQLLCGSNGAGKSTLLRILAGMEKPDSGDITINGDALAWRRARKHLLAQCIYLHQTPYLFEGSVRYNLNYPLRGARPVREAAVQEGLRWSGLSMIADQAVHQLSGGERQRVALTRAWLRRPHVMLLDEPTTNMDVDCRQRTVELLRALKSEGVCLIIATHDPLHFADVADRTLQLADGRLRQGGDIRDQLPDKVTPIGRRVRVSA